MKRLAYSLLSLTILAGGGVALPATAANAADRGGWDEKSGAFVLAPDRSGGFAAFATPKHTGASEEKVISGTTNKRAHGWTTWAGVRHYTTAQLEHYWPNSGVIATSGRQWGTGGTEAISPWKPFDPNATSNGFGQARTYYGN